MHTQSRERRYERFAPDIIEINIDPVRRRQIQLFEHRTGFVIESGTESAFVPQKPHLLRRTGGPDDTARAQLRQLPGHFADRAGGSRNKNDVAGFDLYQIQPDPRGHARHAEGTQVNRERLNLAFDRMQPFRRSNEVFAPTKVGSDGIARLEFPGARLDDLADGAAFERFAHLEWRNIRFPVVHATAHVWVHRHEQI